MMFFRRIYESGLAQASYVIGDEIAGVAMVVDPRRDIDIYTDLAAAEGLRIVAAAETHIHADFLSGGRELAAATGATLYLSGHGDGEHGYLAQRKGVTTKFVRDGDVLAVGDVRVRVRHTPGHTPEHVCYEIFESQSVAQPVMLLSGDFIFVGDLGRPDLLEEAMGQAGAAREGARSMFVSLRKTLAELPDFVQIWPGHGAGSACGKALGTLPATTLGYERRFSWWSTLLERGDEERFVDALLEGQPDAPTYFARMKRLNRGLTEVLGSLPVLALLDTAAVGSQLARGAQLVDTRQRDAFCALHVAGAINVPDRPSFANRAAWFVDPARPIVLLAHSARVRDLARALVRVGLDDIAGYVTEVADAGLPTATLAGVPLEEAQRRWSAGDAVVLDVRQHSEYAQAHIPHVLHVSAGSLAAHLADVPKDRIVLVMCAGGDRSVAAASLLRSRGFHDVSNVPDGFDEWRERGLPVESGDGTSQL